MKSGDEVTFECLSYSNSDNSNVSYEWSYPPELAGGVTVEGGVLVVTDADMNAEVNFTCTVVLEGSGLMNIAVSSLDIGEFTIHFHGNRHCSFKYWLTELCTSKMPEL